MNAKDTKSRALHRIKIISGHIRKLEEMIASNRYCVEVMTQSLAIQNSLKSLNKILLKRHLETCVKKQFLSGKSQQAVEELGRLYSFQE